ncbi:hypothetical protein QBC37DRAFT_288000 [Rhypophila decipiens]|uniref:Uncharacterized protein n=1 Tax=Rhypophila decipiens TaxID=261697 RepID=A0AAN6YAJ0_9PEZI|nr:hypothetical protein QBC37DRAFT_288000 [Rhypophila decipiens]
MQESKSNDNARTELPGPPSAQKTISFDEVYQDGKAKYKHIIVEYPTNSRKYYILKCEEHGVHFNLNPLAGAAKHLHSAQHGNLSKERAQAVELLGYNIFDCDENKMQQNNQTVSDAFEKGYKPLNLNQLTKAERANLNLPGDTSPTATAPKTTPAANIRGSTRENSQKLSMGVTDPIIGELYLAYWPKEKRNYAVLMLPFGKLDRAGLEGTLEDTGLLDPAHAPKCYVCDRTTNVWSWASGYRDGEPNETKREFPVLYIDGRDSVGWVSAKDLSPFNFDDPLWGEIPCFRQAVERYARNKGYQSYQDLREDMEGRDSRFCEFTSCMTPHRDKPGLADSFGADGRNQHPVQQRALSGLIDKSRANTDSQKVGSTMIRPAVEAEMADVSPVSDKDSYQASINKGLDSDNDVDMANTESRRTSVSNRGENQADQAHQTASSASRSPGELAQMIASRALHLKSPERDQPSASTAAQSGDFSRPTIARSELGSASGSAATNNGTGYRRVDNIYTNSSNLYRTSPSQSPAMSTTILPEQRPEMGSSQASMSRNSSPASLNNILQIPSPQPQAVMARPGPLSQNGPASLQVQPHQVRHPSLGPRPLPLDQSGPRTASPPMRSPSVLAGFTQTIQVVARPRATISPAPSAPLPSNPPTRTPTPVILKNSDLLGDRWRAVRAESTPSEAATPATRPPVSQEQITPVETRSNSPAQLRGAGASPAPSVSVKMESNESYALARVTDNNEVIFDHGEAQGRLLPFLVDPQTKTASGSPRPGVELVVDPHKVRQAVVSTSDVSKTASAVTLKTADGPGDRVLELVFETWELNNGRIHARRFCRWMKSVNPLLEIDQQQAK